MALFDEQETDPNSGGGEGGTLGWFTQKMGPLPMWAWIALGTVVVVFYTRKKSPATASTSGADSGTNVLGKNTQTGEDIIVTQMEPGATPEGSPMQPVPVSSPADVQAQRAGLEYGFLNLVTQAHGQLQKDIEYETGYAPTTQVETSGEGSSKAYNEGVQSAYLQVAKMLPKADWTEYQQLIGIDPGNLPDTIPYFTEGVLNNTTAGLVVGAQGVTPRPVG